MAAVRYTKGDQIAEADILELANGKFQGVVLITQNAASQVQHTVATESDSPQEALDEAKALAHRLLT